jgi:hypothetical protein
MGFEEHATARTAVAPIEFEPTRETHPKPRLSLYESTRSRKPTILVVGRSWFSDPDSRRGTSYRLLNNLPALTKRLQGLSNVSLSIAMPGFEFDVLRVLEQNNQQELFVPFRDKRHGALSVLRDATQVRFLATGYTEDSLAAPLALADQYRFSEEALRAAAVPRVTAATLPRSAVDYVGEKLLRRFDSMPLDALIVQRSKSPHQLSPKMNMDEAAILVRNEQFSIPALVGDRILESAFAKYLSGHLDEFQTLSMLEDRVYSLDRANGEPFGTLLFPLEALASVKVADRFTRLYVAANEWAERGGVSLRGFDAHAISFTQALADKPVREYDTRSNPRVRALDDTQLAAERELGEHTGYYRALWLVSRDRGYQKAAERLEQIGRGQQGSSPAREVDCEMLGAEHAIVKNSLDKHVALSVPPTRSAALRERVALLDKVCRLYGQP